MRHFWRGEITSRRHFHGQVENPPPVSTCLVENNGLFLMPSTSVYAMTGTTRPETRPSWPFSQPGRGSRVMPSTSVLRIASRAFPGSRRASPRHSMYAIYAYIGVVLGVNVGIYGIHGVSGSERVTSLPRASQRFDPLSGLLRGWIVRRSHVVE